MIHQLYHVGQHGDFDNSYEPNWSPSGLPSYHDSDGSHAMNEAEIEELIEGFGQAARRAKESGFDGGRGDGRVSRDLRAVLDPLVRTGVTTAGGGSVENRCRFSREVLERVRKYTGEDFIIGLGFGAATPRPRWLCRSKSWWRLWRGTMSAA